MHPTTPLARLLKHAALGVLLACTAAAVQAQPGPAAPGLRDLFEAAWARQPESQALAARREAAQAQRRAAQAWTPEPAALEARHQTDRLTRNDGAREWEVGVAVPLWLPGERARSGALADAQADAAETRADAARLRLAASLRETWWTWQRARVEAEGARRQLDNARLLAADVARRTRAGELARADQHQAEGAVAAAEATAAQADAAAAVALHQLAALAGMSPGAGPFPAPDPEPEPAADAAALHPALGEQQARATLAERAAALADTQSRAHPELTLATTRDRGVAGERYGQTVTVGVRIPLAAGVRHDGRVAAARAEALEAQAQLALERDRLRAEQAAAVVRVTAARHELAATERRATLARETRGFFDKSFRLGETDLPTRLRIEAEAADAERQAARSRIELAAALSAWRQALGLLPQ